MVTRIETDRAAHCKKNGINHYFKAVEFYGLSTDTKPTDYVPNASVFYEMDTQGVYMFDADNAVWLEQ